MKGKRSHSFFYVSRMTVCLIFKPLLRVLLMYGKRRNSFAVEDLYCCPTYKSVEKSFVEQFKK